MFGYHQALPAYFPPPVPPPSPPLLSLTWGGTGGVDLISEVPLSLTFLSRPPPPLRCPKGVPVTGPLPGVPNPRKSAVGGGIYV